MATVKITIKPRADSGIIYYIGKGQYDYLTIELFKGEVSLSSMLSFAFVLSLVITQFSNSKRLVTKTSRV